MFKGAMESEPPSPRSTCGVPLTTLRPFSEIEKLGSRPQGWMHFQCSMLTRASLDDLGRNSRQRRCWWLLANGQGNTKVEIMQNLQVLNSFRSFEIPDIFLFETRFKK